MKDFSGAGEVSAYGPEAVRTAMIQDGDGRRDVRSPAKASHLQLIEGKVWQIATACGFKHVLRLEAVCCVFYFRNKIFKIYHILFYVDVPSF
jgi:hypothetical protein